MVKVLRYRTSSRYPTWAMKITCFPLNFFSSSRTSRVWIFWYARSCGTGTKMTIAFLFWTSISWNATQDLARMVIWLKSHIVTFSSCSIYHTAKEQTLGITVVKDYMWPTIWLHIWNCIKYRNYLQFEPLVQLFLFMDEIMIFLAADATSIDGPFRSLCLSSAGLCIVAKRCKIGL